METHNLRVMQIAISSLRVTKIILVQEEQPLKLKLVKSHLSDTHSSNSSIHRVRPLHQGRVNKLRLSTMEVAPKLLHHWRSSTLIGLC